jgi:hypothetical protein
MPALLYQHHLLSGRRQQSQPRHTGKVATATDTNRNCPPAHVRICVLPRNKC